MSSMGNTLSGFLVIFLLLSVSSVESKRHSRKKTEAGRQTLSTDESSSKCNNNLKSMGWVSKRDPPPGYEMWLEFARENKCHMGAYSRIEKDLDAFRDPENPSKRRITPEQIQKAAAMDLTRLVTVRNGELVTWHLEPNYILDTVISLVSRFRKNLPDLDFPISLIDEPRVLPGTSDLEEKWGGDLCKDADKEFVEQRHLHGFFNNKMQGDLYAVHNELVPLFSVSKINECYRDITYPAFFDKIGSYISAAEEEQLLPWSERKDDLYFRGSSTGGAFLNRSTYATAHRPRLLEYGKGRKNMDFGFTEMKQCSDEVCQLMVKDYGVKDRIDKMEHFKHKYVMVTDGNTHANRFRGFMESGSLVFKSGLFSEWFDEFAVDMKHYIKVALDYSNLEEKLQWAIEHDDEVRAIRLGGRELAKHRLRDEDMACYMYRLLLEYAAIVY